MTEILISTPCDDFLCEASPSKGPPSKISSSLQTALSREDAVLYVVQKAVQKFRPSPLLPSCIGSARTSWALPPSAAAPRHLNHVAAQLNFVLSQDVPAALGLASAVSFSDGHLGRLSDSSVKALSYMTVFLRNLCSRPLAPPE